MSTSSLASQLHALQVQTTGASSQRNIASFLHEPKVAAKIDGRTTFELAKSAMETLCSMDGSLDVFQHTLLHPNKAHAQYSRMLLTKEEVVALDLELGLLLDALSPYFLLPPTHQVIEFLVRKYEIHVWNVDQILAMTICYHESPVFARLITICDLAKHPRWAFLEHVKTNNVPLLRANLSKRCFADYSLVSFLHTAAVRIGARNAKLIALYALVAMEILEKSRVSENILRWVLPNIIDGLKDKSFPERQTAAYMVATKLTTHATLSPAARQQLVVVIAKTAPAHAQFDAFLCLIGVLQSQPFETFPTEALKHIFKFDDVPQLVMDAMEAYDTTKFLALFLDAVALAHTHATSEQLFLDLINALGQIVAPLVASLVRSMLAAAHSTPSVADRLQRLLLVLSKRYPEPFDAGLNAMLTDAGLDSDLQSFCVNFVSTSFTGTAAAMHVPLAESGVSLLLSLDHPTVSVRLHALSVLAEMDAAALEDPDVLLRRLNDDAPSVIVAALVPAVATLLLQTASATQLLDQIAISLNARAFNSAFATAMTALVTFVTGPFRDIHGAAYDATLLDMLLVFAPQSTIVATKPVVAWTTVAPLIATLSVSPFTNGLSKTTTTDDVLGHFGAQTTLAAAPIVEAWAVPSVHRHTPLPLLAMRVLNDGRQATTPGLAAPLLTLLTTTWTALNASTPIDSVDRPRIAEVVEVVCDLMRTSFKTDAVTYDASLVLLLSSTSGYFTLVQPVLHAALAAEASHWTDLFHSLCRLVHTDAPAHVLTRSVMLLSVMIECTPSMVSIGDVHHVVLALLVALAHAHTALRNAAAQCLKSLTKLSLADKKSREAFAVYTPTLTALLKVKEELSMDASYVATFCSAHVSKDKAFLARVLTTALVPHDALSSTLLQRVRNVLRVLHLVHLDAVWTTTIAWFMPLLKTSLTPLTASIGADLLSHYLRAPASATYDVVLATVAAPSAAPLHSHVAKTMTSTWFGALPMGKQTTLVQALVVLLRTGAESTPSDVASLLVRLSLPVRIVKGLLSVTSEPTWAAQTTCVLEVVSNLIATYAVDDLNALLSPLHAVLAQFVAAKDDVSEYSVQMVLTALHGVAVGLRGHASSTTHATSFVELTLRVVQHTISQQTRNAALLFVSSLVDLCPTHVLQSLVPILTFASQLQLDEYSFHVLQEIVTHAVPYVHTDASDISTQQFLATFVAAFETLPIARRSTLFHVLLTALGAHDDDAAAIAVALLLQHANDVPARSAFCHSLLEALDADLQMRALVSLLSIAGQLHSHLAPRAKDDDEDEDDDDETEDVAFEIDPKLANATLDRIVSFVPRHLERKALHHQLLDNSDVEKSLQHAYLLLAQGILLFLRRVTKTKEALAAKKSSMADRWDAIAATALEAMNNLQQLLTAPGFVAVIGELLQHEDGVIRRRALQLLNERIEETEATLTFEEELLFVDMLDDLSSVLEDPSALLTDKQMAILSVDVLTRFFAHKHAQPFLNILPTVMACCKLPLDVTANGHVIGSAFVCLSNLCQSLGPAVFPFVPQFFPTLLHCLDVSTSAGTADASLTLTLQQCLLAAMRAMTTKFPQFLVSYLPKMLHLLFVPSLLNVHHVQIRVSVDATILALATGTELRNLLPALMELYPVCCSRGDVALLRFFEMVTTIVSGMDRAAVKAHMAGLMRLYLVALDLRRLHPSIGEHVEDQLIAALLALVMKLSEKQLKPLFLKLVSWVDVVLPTTQGPSHARQVVFFRVVSQLSEKLKSIFVPYFAHILPLCASILLSAIDAGAALLEAEDADGFFERPTKKAKKEVEDPWPLATHVVTALIGCCSHDTDGFMDKEKFDVVMPPLVDLLGLASLEVARPVVDGAVQALAHLAWAAKNDLLWKPMHHRILMKSRAEEPAVRLATLQTIEQCYAIVGEEFLAMLPESIPFLAELLEDHDANVEALCHKVIRQIEDISGESLDQYLTA
ncbi:hypothetical protein SPRG_00426 [Saprolegnia parasitica CBS 223.65]|uniref:HEAT repeat-containing protein 1 n=1 Tax=Saprolegnia parasitica (strain CBS 223.65) TaxID=695850 RepID=A0A067CY02_SAPPC|nr:hypothetical protein SPRG_00426 [Saprolegnia parasitica CBS 223.65]KDO35584.1 hypothetical protein SPRG_00426 [Saprolegnia parasitica CBS 223.65]|eukprot:XP_012193915.1 hypothetical protein SPRG_00426 [Saprolegnia parasitica CBS 223.65]